MSDDFRFGDPRFPTCCAKPRGCTNKDPDECPLWNHLWKRLADPDHPNHIPSEPARMIVWLCAEYGMRSADAPGFDTEAEANAAAEVLARAGKVAYVWPVEVE